MYDYSLFQWLLIFYIYCVLGWMFESTVVSVQQRRPVNRGFLRGPMLPIYGFGAVILLHVALPLDGHPVAMFFAGMVVATAFEYVVGVIMESLFKVRYWDYSTHKFQFQGRICLQSSLAWGALSVILPYFIHRPVEDLLQDLSPIVTAVLACALSVYFVADVIGSVKTALGIAKLLEEVDKMRAEADAVRAQLTEQAEKTREQLTLAAQEMRAQGAAAMEERRQRIMAASEERRLQLHLALREADSRISERVERMRRTSKWMVRGNPTLRSGRYQDAVEELRRRLKRG